MSLETTSWKSVRDVIRDRNIVLETKDPIVQEGFTQVPNHILKSNQLTVGEKLTFAMFLSYAWNNDLCFPGQQKLAKDLGVNERSVRTYTQGLQKKGFLVVRRRGLGKTNLYTLRYRIRSAKRRSARPAKLSGQERKNWPTNNMQYVHTKN